MYMRFSNSACSSICGCSRRDCEMCIDFGVIASLQHLAEEFDDRLATGYTPRPQKKKNTTKTGREREETQEKCQEPYSKKTQDMWK